MVDCPSYLGSSITDDLVVLLHVYWMLLVNKLQPASSRSSGDETTEFVLFFRLMTPKLLSVARIPSPRTTTITDSIKSETKLRSHDNKNMRLSLFPVCYRDICQYAFYAPK